MGYPDASNEYYVPTGIMTPVECAAAVAQWPEVTGWSMMSYELKVTVLMKRRCSAAHRHLNPPTPRPPASLPSAALRPSHSGMLT